MIRTPSTGCCGYSRIWQTRTPLRIGRPSETGQRRGRERDFTGVIRPPTSPSFHLPGRFCADERSVKLRAGHRSNPQSKVTKEYEIASAKAAEYASVQELGPTPARVMSWRQTDRKSVV